MNEKEKQLGNEPADRFEKVEFNPNGWPKRIADITKREYFAGLAMQALSARIEIYEKWATHTGRYEKHLAEEAVRCADALLEELSK